MRRARGLTAHENNRIFSPLTINGITWGLILFEILVKQ